jgi:hypothetical protein
VETERSGVPQFFALGPPSPLVADQSRSASGGGPRAAAEWLLAGQFPDCREQTVEILFAVEGMDGQSEFSAPVAQNDPLAVQLLFQSQRVHAGHFKGENS